VAGVKGGTDLCGLGAEGVSASMGESSQGEEVDERGKEN
jgi:hypothetical protein